MSFDKSSCSLMNSFFGRSIVRSEQGEMSVAPGRLRPLHGSGRGVFRSGFSHVNQNAAASGGRSVNNDDYSVSKYLEECNEAYQKLDGVDFATLLSLTGDHCDPLLDSPSSSALWDREAENSPEPSDLIHLSRTISADYLNLISCHLKVLFYLNRQDLQAAFNYQEEMSKLVAGVLPKLQNEDVSWFLNTISTVARDISSLAIKVDQQNRGLASLHDGQTSSIDRAFNSIQIIVRTCAAEKSASEEHSKKRALVPLVNQLFRLCFRTGRANLCKPLVRTIENLKILDRCPASQVVTYHYFAGKLAVVEGDYVLAEQRLSIAYQKCSPLFTSNMKAILRLLIPLRLRMDIRPSEELLKKYDLHQYQEIVLALQKADIGMFQQARDQHEKGFIRWSIFYLIDNLRLIMFRHVFRKLCSTLKTHIISVVDFSAALRAAGYRTPIDEDPAEADAECIIVNLIGEDLVKAYVSWQLKKIVVSKAGVFPSLRKTPKIVPA